MSLYRVIIDFKQSLIGGDPAQLALPSFGSQSPQANVSEGFWDILLAWFKHDAGITSNLLDYKSQFGEESDNPNAGWGDEKVPVILIDQSNTYVVLLDPADDSKTLVKIIAGHNTQSGESSGSSNPNIDSVGESLLINSPEDGFDFKPILVGFDDLSNVFSPGGGNGEGYSDFPPLIVPVFPEESPTPAPLSGENCDFKPTIFNDVFNLEDNQLSLREAIELANTNRNGVDTICLDFGTYTMSFQPIEEGSEGPAPYGDFDILEDLIIHGEGKDNTFIDANWISRIFEVFGNVSLTLQDLTLTHGAGWNGDPINGGAILNYGHLFLENVGIVDNSADLGGGIASFGGSFDVSVTIYNSVIAGNFAGQDGGGIYLNNSDLSMSFSTVNCNSVSTYNEEYESYGSGGGIFVSGLDSVATIYASTLSNNEASYGGGVFVGGAANFGLINSTVSGNIATEGGGAIYVANGAQALIENSTITDNSSYNYSQNIFPVGAIEGESFSNITLESSIVAANAYNEDLAGTAFFFLGQVFNSQGHNLIGNVGFSDFFLSQKNTDIVGGQFGVIDPLLGPLQDNGGPTLTHALYSGSPAIGNGNNPENLPTDQRGEPREFPPGQTDIGAFQSDGIGESYALPPIVLDMNGDGAKLVSLSGSQLLMFDADGDGIQDVMKSWASPEDAFLAYDADGSHSVSSVREIAFSGYSPGAKTDLEGLQQAFDSNSDGVLNNQDSEFDHFGVWKDSNQNGASDKGEFLSLADVGIVSISLAGNNELVQGAGYTVFNSGSYATADGAQHAYVDVGLAYTPVAAPAGIKEAIGDSSETPALS